MTPAEFIDKWSRADRTERQAAQEHFIDLCRLLDEPTPNEAADPDGYSFEKGVSKTDGSGGFADVWKRGHFGWEYKKDKANLDRAYQQLQLYSVALEHPPLLVVSDTKRFRIYTNWTNTVQEKHDFTLEDLAHSGTRELLQNVFRHPERLQPQKTREQVTKDVAKDFSAIAERLRMKGHAPEKVAHFLNRLVFCLFAEDVELLQDDLFKRMLDTLAKRRDEVPARSQKMLSELFANMRQGGEYGLEHILHFNGGLFNDDEALPLDADSLDMLRTISKQDWSAIDPTIFGTLFERFLDPDKRAQIGAHYTDPGKIMMIVEPVILRPLNAEWDAVKAELVEILSRNRNRDGTPGSAAINRAEIRLDAFLKRLAGVRVLDPACGSGNFLYLALQSLKDLELRIVLDAETMGMARRVIHCGPQNVKGIEINPYAAELARTSIWIGNIQWMRRNGFEARKEPVLEDLESIECRDALIVELDRKVSAASSSLIDIEYGEARWPHADFIIGNPPFLGGKLLRDSLGDDYVEALFDVYNERVPPEADLVIYWFEKSRAQLRLGNVHRVGLVATNSIRGGANRRLLERIQQETTIFEAWSDEPWVIEGASVRISIVCFGPGPDVVACLNGTAVTHINPDLTSDSFDLTRAKRLLENINCSFQGVKFGGPFEVEEAHAQEFLQLPLNPNGCSNSDVLRLWCNGMDVTRRKERKWCVDFGLAMTERNASLYEAPFAFLRDAFEKENARRKAEGKRPLRGRELRTLGDWWIHQRPRGEMRNRLTTRYIVTPEVSKHRLFQFFEPVYLTSGSVYAIARDDHTAFGILQSSWHTIWSLRLGTINLSRAAADNVANKSEADLLDA